VVLSTELPARSRAESGPRPRIHRQIDGQHVLDEAVDHKGQPPLPATDRAVRNRKNTSRLIFEVSRLMLEKRPRKSSPRSRATVWGRICRRSQRKSQAVKLRAPVALRLGDADAIGVLRNAAADCLEMILEGGVLPDGSSGAGIDLLVAASKSRSSRNSPRRMSPRRSNSDISR